MAWLMVASHGLVHVVATHHYLALFLLVLVEEAGCLLPLPGESLMVFAGSRIARGQMSIGLTYLAVMPASAIGCSILYVIARTGGRALILRLFKRIRSSPSGLERAEARMNRIGPAAVLLGRLTPGIRVPTGIAAGVFRVRFASFMCFALLATAMRLTFFLYIGATAQHLGAAIAITRDARFITAVVVLAAILAGWLALRRRRRRSTGQVLSQAVQP